LYRRFQFYCTRNSYPNGYPEILPKLVFFEISAFVII
jgi:hypothetical protein